MTGEARTGSIGAVKPEELDELIAGNVRARRARLRMTQEELADEMGWTRSMVTSLESKARRVTVADAWALCQALNISLAELLDGAPVDVFQAFKIDER